MSRYLAFVALMTVLCLIPGPAVILAMQKAVMSGYRGALRTAAGVLAADLVWAAAAAAGVSAVIVASQPAFLALRFAGAAYLVYLGARLLFAPKDKLLPMPAGQPARQPGAQPEGAGQPEGAALEATPTAGGEPAVRRQRAFRQGFLCDMTNPKTLLVFTSVLPQFVPAGSAAWTPALLGVTFALLGFGSLNLYSAMLGRAGGVLKRPRLARRLMRGSGGVLVGFGVALTVER